MNVGVAGFEPAAFRSQSGRATKLRHTPWTDRTQGGFGTDSIGAVG